jgi:hypothetical protein
VSALRGAAVKQVMVLEICEGEGTQGDPCRIVTYVLELDGTAIASSDPIMESRHAATRERAAREAMADE